MNFFKTTLLLLFLSGLICRAEVISFRSEKTSSLHSMRERVLEQPLFYAEIQSYRLVENYLHYWMDRPLFHDSTLRTGDSYHQSFVRNVEILKEYEINGFTALSNSGGLMSMYEGHLMSLAQVPPYAGFSYMCGAGYSAKPNAEWIERYLKNYTMALNSPYTLKINGKIPIWAYRSSALNPKQIKELSDMLREKTSVEPILFVQPKDMKFRQLYEENGRLTQLQIDKLRATLTNLLDVSGGLMVTPKTSRFAGGDYTSKPDSNYYRNCMLPVLLDLLSQPQYKEKLIGAYIGKGYINHLSGNNSGEYGTSNFRQAMDELLLLNPDVIVFFEWNEANENTHFQPTVNNGQTMQRLIRFYARKMRGQLTTPNKGDDLSIPNLVFSSRQVFRLGDMIRYELLNVPDSDLSDEYQAQLIIRDYDGKIIKSFSEEIFTVAEMKAVTFELPSEQFAEHTVIVPELRIVNSEGKEHVFTMQYNRIHPSICWNYKEILQPLREQLPLRATFNVEPTESSHIYKITAKANSPERLMQLELLDNESEIFAVDREKRYDPENNIVIQGSFTAFSTSNREIIFEVLNAPGWQWFRECHRYKKDEPEPQIVDNKLVVPDYYINYYYRYPFNITIPKIAVKDAMLEINIERLGKHAFKIAELKELGKMSRAFDGNNRLDLHVVKNLVDTPVPLQENEANFTVFAETESRFPIYQLRGISNSGKIYRSRPVMPLRPQGEIIRHNVFSSAKVAAVTVEIAKDRIPELNYVFDNAYGALLKNSWEPFFDAQLGGGFIYLEPFNRPRPKILQIPGRSNLHPAWSQVNNHQLLSFDGKANYINFPREALPFGSFTLEFEIKLQGEQDQVLFRNASYHCGSLNLYRRGGKLDATFTHRKEGIHNPYKAAEFETDLELPLNKWLQVSVSYNYRELIFTVDGVTRKYPFTERARFFKSSVFGGYTLGAGKDMHFFKGELRSLRIQHTAEP